MKFVYNSFNGRYSDNPRAIHRALLRDGSRHEHVWLVDERHRGGFPRNVRTVPIASRAAVAALESADVLVANCHTDLDHWEKGPGTLYIQTWHGTPLKRIHRSALQGWGVDVMDSVDGEIARWDRLITPSTAGTQLLRSAFGYTGAVLETGYPRNDVLMGADRDQRRARVRHQLGIRDGTTAVLYAPTYRDDELDGEDVPLALDSEALAGSLGDGYVLLLRLHYFLGHRRNGTRGQHIQDLSSFPEIADLYLAADVLVTDYSSALFDFAVTGKPILLYTYDLEHYRDRLRGFTVDLDEEAPGPLLHNQAELTAALSDLPQVAAAYAERYAAFQERYCHLEDGRATERVLAALQTSTAGLERPGILQR